MRINLMLNETTESMGWQEAFRKIAADEIKEESNEEIDEVVGVTANIVMNVF